MTIPRVHRANSAAEIMSTPVLTFRWKYVVLPCLVLVLSLAAAAGSYGRLPASVAYHFAEGAPDLWAGRQAVLAVLLVPQFIGTMAAFAVAWAVIMLGRRYQGADTRLVGRIVLVMGNMVGLPQLVLSLATLDILSYNAYHVHVPFLALALAVTALGVVGLGIVFFGSVRGGMVRRPAGGIPKEHK